MEKVIPVEAQLQFVQQSNVNPNTNNTKRPNSTDMLFEQKLSEKKKSASQPATVHSGHKS